MGPMANQAIFAPSLIPMKVHCFAISPCCQCENILAQDSSSVLFPVPFKLCLNKPQFKWQVHLALFRTNEITALLPWVAAIRCQTDKFQINNEGNGTYVLRLSPWRLLFNGKRQCWGEQLLRVVGTESSGGSYHLLKLSLLLQCDVTDDVLTFTK